MALTLAWRAAKRKAHLASLSAKSKGGFWAGVAKARAAAASVAGKPATWQALAASACIRKKLNSSCISFLPHDGGKEGGGGIGGRFRRIISTSCTARRTRWTIYSLLGGADGSWAVASGDKALEKTAWYGLGVQQKTIGKTNNAPLRRVSDVNSMGTLNAWHLATTGRQTNRAAAALRWRASYGAVIVLRCAGAARLLLRAAPQAAVAALEAAARARHQQDLRVIACSENI